MLVPALPHHGWERVLVPSLRSKSQFWGHFASPEPFRWGSPRKGAPWPSLKLRPHARVPDAIPILFPSGQDGGIVLTVQDRPHSPVLGAGLTGGQHHRARFPAGVESVLARRAEALEEGDVDAGGPPLSLQGQQGLGPVPKTGDCEGASCPIARDAVAIPVLPHPFALPDRRQPSQATGKV